MTAGFAVIVAVIVVALVARQAKTERPVAASAPTALEVGAPGRIDETDVVSVLMTTEAVPAGTDLSAAISRGLVTSVQAPADLTPDDAVTRSSSTSGVVATALAPQVIVTDSTLAASTKAAPANTASCPTDWKGPLAPDDRIVFTVKGTVAKGTSVAQAYADGALKPYAVSARDVPRTALAALAPACSRVAAFDLTQGTMLTSGTFVAP